VEDPRELLADGIAALRAKDLRQAETFFLEACQAYARKDRQLSSQEFAYHKAACYGLGRVYRLTGRYELAVMILERALPNPVAFKDLINTFRSLAHRAEKEGDEHARWA
jgi:tetratricopeptide (TPR) repeat protein